MERILPNVVFKSVSIDLESTFGLSRDSIVAASNTVEMRVVSPFGGSFGSIGVPQNLVKENTDSLTIAYPAGEVWKIRLSLRHGSASTYKDLVLR